MKLGLLLLRISASTGLPDRCRLDVRSGLAMLAIPSLEYYTLVVSVTGLVCISTRFPLIFTFKKTPFMILICQYSFSSKTNLNYLPLTYNLNLHNLEGL